MTKRILVSVLLAAACAGGLLAQKPVQVKSKGEGEAIQALQTALQSQNPDSIIQAGESLVTKYADTDFKSIALLYMASAYQAKNDFEHMVIYAERTLEADPENYRAMLMLATGIAQRTREFDLDREEKLATAERHAKKAMELMTKAQKPNPNLADDQWNMLKNEALAQGHEALALVALGRKQFDGAISEFKMALGTDQTPNPGTMVRLGLAYEKAGKYDDAIGVFDKVMAAADAHPQIKQFAQAERARSMQAKNAAAKPPAQPAPPAAPTAAAEPAKPEQKNP